MQNLYAFGAFTNLTRTELHPDLRPYFVGQTLRHPLVEAEWVDSRKFSYLNRLYEYRRQLAAGATHVRNEWELLRPDLSAFQRLHWFYNQIFPDESGVFKETLNHYDRIVGQIWTDPELLWHSSGNFATLLARPLPAHVIDELMIESERRQLSDLPDTLQIYRGHVPILTGGGVCWTLNPTVAVDWACRFDPEQCESLVSPASDFQTPVVTVGKVSKSQIIALINRRGDDEILVDCQYVQDRQTYPVVRIP